jgi:tetratricopeptide (TPR) repeat protein
VACLSAALTVLAAGCGEQPAPAAGAAILDATPGLVADAIARARSLEHAGSRDAAEAEWEGVLALRPVHASALYATARLRWRRGDHAGALERLGKLRTVEPNAGRGWLLAAEILADPSAGPVRDLGGSEASARAALERNPEESGPHLLLGRVILLAGRPDEAAERLAVAARMNPRDAESRSLLGTVRLRQGRPDEARRLFRDAIRCGGGQGVGVVPAGVPGEGDTGAALAAGRIPSAGELRAAAGLAALEAGPDAADPARPAPEYLRAAALEALRARGTGEAVLLRGADGPAYAAVVEGTGGPVIAVLEAGGVVRVFR